MGRRLSVRTARGGTALDARACLGAVASGLVAIAVAPVVARAQDAERALRPNAFVVNAGPMLGILGTGFYGRVDPEFQLHRDARFGGHMLGLGLAITYWPNEYGLSAAFAPRYQYDQQLVPGTPFFVSPYAGLDVGVGFFDIFSDGNPLRVPILVAPSAGVDLKLVLGNHWILGFRPIGITVPIQIAFTPAVTADVFYDIALVFGFTY